MLEHLPPGSLLVLGALVVPFLRGVPRQGWLLALPVLSFAHLLSLDHGSYGHVPLFDMTLTVTRVDKLSLVWGYIFHIAAFLSALYANHVKDELQQVAALIYAGSAIAGAFAGDLITLFVCWELTAVSSVFLIWASRTERSYRAGMRYLIIQVGSGVLLLSGVLIHYGDTGSLAFDNLGPPSFSENLGPTLIFIAFGMKCAFPFLHNWLQDAYPEATATGTVFLSAFTTKLAVYALARGFAGTEILVPIGAAMTAFPVFYAVLENDLRRVLAYSLNNQLGFMVVGVGIGSEMALNGAASHAFAHILYKALLFMSMGAILHRVGTVKATELGMLYRSMPLTTFFCIIGALSISAFPLFSGFVTKSMTLTAAAEGHYDVAFFVLLFASAGVLHHSGIKIPFYGFFGHHDAGIRVQEAPWNMLLAMGITAFLCVAIGVYPQPLYSILPYPVDFDPYTASHVITQLQLLVFALLAFVVLALKHLETPELRCTNVDFDVIYRKLLPWVVGGVGSLCAAVRDGVIGAGKSLVELIVAVIYMGHGPSGVAARTLLTSTSVAIVIVLLAVYLLFNYQTS
ncbi:MAG TPA: Na(+)/H(+) antiporter subunit D [Candidatus Latescibacteria bacterium]|jgi:multicomponent Na+:H+ antiporter subunit D|nr:Na(+)/H(+) antiporter subunit D [Candidatus Latescibacterota bacterium]HJP32488.1 Na(+)/H(+) antiporter subunit D [Candidatus Latescibacterota bacterium]